MARSTAPPRPRPSALEPGCRTAAGGQESRLTGPRPACWAAATVEGAATHGSSLRRHRLTVSSSCNTYCDGGAAAGERPMRPAARSCWGAGGMLDKARCARVLGRGSPGSATSRTLWLVPLPTSPRPACWRSQATWLAWLPTQNPIFRARPAGPRSGSAGARKQGGGRAPAARRRAAALSGRPRVDARGGGRTRPQDAPWCVYWQSAPKLRAS